jgi:UDP-N-acetyl-D-mannosaminuronic acid dehydrogenase
LSKLVENANRDVNVAFANELSLVCDSLGIDVWSVIRMANLHPRVNILSPGPGVGGHCIPVDPWFIHQALPERTPLIKAAREVNDGKPHFVADRIVKLAKRFRQPVIGLLGLSYKPNVDDLRESPALEIACKVASRRVGTVLAVEPHLRELPPPLANYPGVQLTDLATAVKRADVVGILVAHNKFRSLDRGAVASKVVVDTVGLLAGLDDAASGRGYVWNCRAGPAPALAGGEPAFCCARAEASRTARSRRRQDLEQGRGRFRSHAAVHHRRRRRRAADGGR